MNGVEVTRYNPQAADCWNAFIDQALNSTFLFQRGYMDYHQDRFEDWSLMAWQKGKLVALLPASRHGTELVSHGGLTYGGFVVNHKMNTSRMLAVFEATQAFLCQNRFTALVYKAIPHIYHQVPCESDLYGLYRHKASLVQREISSAISTKRRLGVDAGKRQRIKKMRHLDLPVTRSEDFSGFMAIVQANLQAKYGKAPTHTAVEMALLAGRFPDCIKLYVCERAGEILAGAIIYETPTVAHAQYLASTGEGRSMGALDYVIDFLIFNVFAGKDFFDFGISTEQRGWVLNEGLIKQKEEFGARGVAYDTYRLQW